MSLIGNILWFIFFGGLAGLWYILGGLVACLTIIGIPFGIQAIKLGFATMAPFGKRLVEVPDADSPLRLIANLIWLVTFGWGVALFHVAGAVSLAVTIIGIPFALQHVKLIPMALLPFGRELRD